MNAFTLWCRPTSLHSDKHGNHALLTGMEAEFRIISSIADCSHRLMIRLNGVLRSYPIGRRDA